MLADAPDLEKRKAINTIESYLAELRAGRPSVTMSAGRSAKGAQTLKAILRASRAVFVRDGHAGLTMRKVAAAAGLAVGNISYYFDSKSALIEATLREELADYVEEHVRQFETDRHSPLEILLNVIGFYVGNARQSHRFFYQMWGFAASDDAAKDLIRDLYRPIGRFIYYLVKAARPTRPDADVRRIVLQIFSLEEGLKLFIGMGPANDPALRASEADARELARRLIMGE
jgi:AcrR family transcriptional regulator